MATSARLSRPSRFLDLRRFGAGHMRFTRGVASRGPHGLPPVAPMGGAGEFVDFREYSGGEDLRRLDWKVLARREGLRALHEEETNCFARW